MSVEQITQNEGKGCPVCKKGILHFEGYRKWDRTNRTAIWKEAKLVCDNCDHRTNLLGISQAM